MPSPKLTPEQVAAVRAKVATEQLQRGERTRIAESLGISRSGLSEILSGKRRGPRNPDRITNANDYRARIFAKFLSPS